MVNLVFHNYNDYEVDIMNQRDIELLLSLEQTKNITATSENFFITQSALSKRLNALEAELQVQIVLRSRHGVQFTPAGEIVLKRIHQIHQQFGLMQSELTEITHEVTGSLKIGVSYNFARYQFSQVLASFKKRYPKVAISVQTANSPRFAMTCIPENWIWLFLVVATRAIKIGLC